MTFYITHILRYNTYLGVEESIRCLNSNKNIALVLKINVEKPNPNYYVESLTFTKYHNFD